MVTLEVHPYEERARLQRCSVYIPNLLPGLDGTLESTFTLLKGQNSGVQTDKWEIYSELNKES